MLVLVLVLVLVNPSIPKSFPPHSAVLARHPFSLILPIIPIPPCASNYDYDYDYDYDYEHGIILLAV